MPTAAREPKGTLTAGSLRSPPMLKPAMTPERHPDKRESEAGNSVKETALPRVVASSPGAFPGNCHLQQCKQGPRLHLPWQLGRHLQGGERGLCGACYAQEEIPPNYKPPYHSLESTKDEGVVLKATQRF